MIFSAGYNLRRRTFFKYFSYIFIFGIIGTIISFSVIAPLTYVSNKANLFKYTFRQNTNSTIKKTFLNFFQSNNNTYNSSTTNKSYQESIISRPADTILTNINIYAAVGDENSNNNDNTSSSYDLNFSLSEILLFSSVITATDTVAALTFVKENTEPKLFSIMLGEGVINDAVCIVLYKIIQKLSSKAASIVIYNQ